MKAPLYFANPCSSAGVAEAMGAGELGFIDTPRQRNRRPAGLTWCADNGAFGKEYDEGKWWAFLVKHAADAERAVFATAPDVVGDAAATLAKSAPFFEPMRRLGYRVALVAQDGQESLPVPWAEIDALFIGGSTEWKTSEHAARLMAEAKARGKWVHVGRVNSYKRLRWAAEHGADSVDGTFLRFAPTENLDRLRAWYSKLAREGITR